MKRNLIKGPAMDSWEENGILHIKWKPEVVELDAAKVIVQQRLEAAADRQHLLLVDSRDTKSITKEARDYFASKEGTKGVIACAIVTESVVANFAANFFLRINQPIVPTKLFTSTTEAEKWLLSHEK